MTQMSENDAKRIFDNKLSICKALGGDVREACLAACIARSWIEKFIAADHDLTAFFDRHDESGNPRE